MSCRRRTYGYGEPYNPFEHKEGIYIGLEATYYLGYSYDGLTFTEYRFDTNQTASQVIGYPDDFILWSGRGKYLELTLDDLVNNTNRYNFKGGEFSFYDGYLKLNNNLPPMYKVSYGTNTQYCIPRYHTSDSSDGDIVIEYDNTYRSEAINAYSDDQVDVVIHSYSGGYNDYFRLIISDIKSGDGSINKITTRTDEVNLSGTIPGYSDPTYHLNLIAFNNSTIVYKSPTEGNVIVQPRTSKKLSPKQYDSSQEKYLEIEEVYLMPSNPNFIYGYNGSDTIVFHLDSGDVKEVCRFKNSTCEGSQFQFYNSRNIYPSISYANGYIYNSVTGTRIDLVSKVEQSYSYSSSYLFNRVEFLPYRN